MTTVAVALRMVTAAMQAELESGGRSSHIDANDLIDVLLAVADEIDPLFGPLANNECGPIRLLLAAAQALVVAKNNQMETAADWRRLRHAVRAATKIANHRPDR